MTPEKNETATQARAGEPVKLAQVVSIAAQRKRTHSSQSEVSYDIRRTDLGNCRLFVKKHGANVRYCHTLKGWLIWDSGRWKPDSNGEVVRMVKDAMLQQYEEAARIEDLNFAAKSLNMKAIREVIQAAQSELPIAISAGDLDCDPWLLNATNVTVDLRTGSQRSHDRNDLLTKQCPIEYDAEAKCPRWERFLSEVFASNPDLVPFVQRAVGYSLTGDVREECLFLMYGEGRNGKGVFIKTIASVLGGYAGTADFSTFLASRDDGRPQDGVAAMRGQRFVASQESREGAELSEALIKTLTGGDVVRARRLFENSYEFLPTAKIWMATNHKPRIKGMDTGIWSRLKLLPFVECFEGREDKTLKTRLQAEASGILAWAVKGCAEWLRVGLSFPESVLKATAEYRLESDQLGRFMEERCECGKHFTARARDLYMAYRKWSADTGETILSETAFGRQMASRGVGKERDSMGSTYQGIHLQNAPDLDDRDSPF